MTNTTPEEAIAAIIAARADAVRRGDVDAMVAATADGILIFDVVGPLRRAGKAGARKRAADWLGSYDGPVGMEDRDVEIVVDGDVAFSHGLSHATGRLKTGAEIDMWFRTTLGFRRIDGDWLIVHEHGSSPFDPESGKASLGLKP